MRWREDWSRFVRVSWRGRSTRSSGAIWPIRSGHGLGASWHEEPRIVPGSKTVLEAGMVVALEPGVYASGEGVRVEHVVLVTDDGFQLLSGHTLDL